LRKKTKRAEPEESGRRFSWSLRGRTYVAVTTIASRGPEPLDEDRANSMTDEGGPPRLDAVADLRRELGAR
jgi:hypothetical protein